MRKVNQEAGKKLVLNKKTIMKLNDDMMRRIEAGFNTITSTGPMCDDKTGSCNGCQTAAAACPSGICPSGACPSEVCP